MKLEKLKKEFPKLFDKNFYFECDNGWFELIKLVCVGMNNYKKNFKILKFVQIKEKFGLLRIYIKSEYNNINHNFDKNNLDNIQNFIYSIEEISSIVCEKCGQIKTDKRNVGIKIVHGWWKKTLCGKCHRRIQKCF